MDVRLRRLIALQVGVTLAGAALLLAFNRLNWALSALVGGGIGTAATIAAGVCVGGSKGGQPARLLGAQFLAEFVKIGVTIGLFIAAFLFYRDVVPGALFIAYAATLAAYGLALALKE